MAPTYGPLQGPAKPAPVSNPRIREAGETVAILPNPKTKGNGFSMLKMLLAALLLCAGCYSPEASEGVTRTYTTPDTYKTCTLAECPEIPFPSMIMVFPDDTLYVPVKARITEVFVTCLAADATAIPEGAMRVTFESTDGVTKRTYDPRSYDWVPVVPDIGFVGMTNISSVEIDCSVTYATDN